VCIFAGDRVRLGDGHPAAGPSDATKKVDPLSAWYFMQNVWYQITLPTKKLVFRKKQNPAGPGEATENHFKFYTKVPGGNCHHSEQ
jgi:hypothetical protein